MAHLRGHPLSTSQSFVLFRLTVSEKRVGKFHEEKKKKE